MIKPGDRRSAALRRALATVFGGALIAASGVGSALAATAPGAAASVVGDASLNGYWNIDALARADAQEGLRAELTPAGQELARQNAAIQKDRLAHGDTVGLASYTCGRLGVPFIVGTSEPWLLIVTPDEVVQIAERRQMPPRHFYTDGRAWPDLNEMPPSSQGYSIAHWEGNELVVETRGLPSGGIQGGGLKGPRTLLTERATLSADGNRLTWTYIWTDPDLLAKPLILALNYDRAPEHTYAYTHPCDPNKEAGATVYAPK